MGNYQLRWKDRLQRRPDTGKESGRNVARQRFVLLDSRRASQCV